MLARPPAPGAASGKRARFAARRPGLLRLGLARGEPELPVAFLPLAEGIEAALEAVMRVGFYGRLAALGLAVGEGLLRRDLAHEIRLRRLPFDRRAILAVVQYLRHGRAEFLY